MHELKKFKKHGWKKEVFIWLFQGFCVNLQFLLNNFLLTILR